MTIPDSEMITRPLLQAAIDVGRETSIKEITPTMQLSYGFLTAISALDFLAEPSRYFPAASISRKSCWSVRA